MTNDPMDDPVWQTAWRWLMLEHEQRGLNPAQHEALRAWLAEPAHGEAMAQARHIWRLSGMVPPASDD